jgi:glycosyltransferase involved in cell wall biosynthesis
LSPSSATPYLTVLMPAYNEEANLASNVPLLLAKLSALGIRYELLIVDDGSHDATPRLADELAASDAQVRVLHHVRNRGIGRALYTGFQGARGRYTIFIPADLAMDLDDLGKYLDAAQEADVVVGLRSDRRGTPVARRMVSLVNIALVRLLFGMPIRQFQYICMWPTCLLHEIAVEYPDSPFLQAEVLIKARDMGYRLAEVEVTYLPRTRGHPTGGRTRMVLKSAYDLFHFWLRWLFRRRSLNGRRDWRGVAFGEPVPGVAANRSAGRAPANHGCAGSRSPDAANEAVGRAPASHGRVGSRSPDAPNEAVGRAPASHGRAGSEPRDASNESRTRSPASRLAGSGPKGA